MTSERLQTLFSFLLFVVFDGQRDCLRFVVVASISFFVLLNKDQHHRKQSSVGGVRLLRLAVHAALGETRIEVADELFDV
jgi:hypothetical protein